MSRGHPNWCFWIAAFAVLLFVAAPSPVTAKKPVKPPPEPEPDPDPAIAFVKIVTEGKGKNQTTWNRLMVMNADGSNQTTVYETSTAALCGADWSPDGDRLVFSTRSGGVGSIYTVKLDGTSLTAVRTDIEATASMGPPVWSPDAVPGVGDDVYRIAFKAVNLNEQPHIYLVDLDGTDLVRLVSSSTLGETCPTWSPSAEKLAFKVRDANDRTASDLFGIYDFTTDEYAVDHLGGDLEGSDAWRVAWSKTQEDKLAWSAAVPGRAYYDIWIVDLDTPSSPVRITSESDVAEHYPSWSEDDSRIVYERADYSGKLVSFAFGAIDTDGTDAEVIAGESGMPVWRR
jgi:Tol biopolymer transport system component